MEIRDVAELMNRTARTQDGARVGQLHPARPSDNSLLAVDLVELQPGASTSLSAAAEEQVVFVLSGSGEAGTAAGGTTVRLQANSLLRTTQGEAHRVRNTGSDTLRLLVVTSLIAWSPRALGLAVEPATARTESRAADSRVEVSASTPTPAPAATPVEHAPSAPPQAETPARPARTPEPTPAAAPVPPAPEVAPSATSTPTPAQEEEAPRPDISGLVKRASELPQSTRPERKRIAEPPPAPEETAVEAAPQEEEEEAPSNLMELLAVFDGGSRGNPGQGYGSFLVQSPGRKPVIRRLEFGDNYTNNQAEYDTLIGCLNYIIERLEITNRSPEQVQLEIKTDSDLVANQLLGTFKVKDAGLRKRHTQALELLDRFALWSIEWHPREESVRLLGH